MEYIPFLYTLDAELSALENQTFSQNIIPVINIIKDKKSITSSKSILDDLERIITSKSSNNFFVNIPMNLELDKKNLKKPLDKFFTQIKSDENYQISILKRFDAFDNVIPVIDVTDSSYKDGTLSKMRSQLKSKNVAYIFYAKKSENIFKDLSTLITSDDTLIYYLDTHDFYKKSIKDEIKKINKLKSEINFKTIVIKQIYNNLTFFNMPNGEIKKTDPAYDLIDYDFFNDFTVFGFDCFGDHAGIRSTPIYSGGLSYPSYIGLNTSSMSHFGFRGTEKSPTSYATVLLPNILNSDYWNKTLASSHKKYCYACSQIELFEHMHVPKDKSNPINNAATWKLLTICHYISMMDYKLKNNLIPQD